jgi:glycosyltransferase involved in cell wall biosynthesis
MAAFFHECEVTVLPSINSTESYGLVQVESMTCGTPVVASDLPGVRVPVSMTGMGRIFPPADPNKLAEVLIEVLDQPAEFHGQPDTVVRMSSPASVAAEYEQAFELARQLSVKKSTRAIRSE